MSPGIPLILGSKGQRSRSRITKKHCWRGSTLLWVLASSGYQLRRLANERHSEVAAAAGTTRMGVNSVPEASISDNVIAFYAASCQSLEWVQENLAEIGYWRRRSCVKKATSFSNRRPAVGQDRTYPILTHWITHWVISVLEFHSVFWSDSKGNGPVRYTPLNYPQRLLPKHMEDENEECTG